MLRLKKPVAANDEVILSIEKSSWTLDCYDPNHLRVEIRLVVLLLIFLHYTNTSILAESSIGICHSEGWEMPN